MCNASLASGQTLRPIQQAAIGVFIGIQASSFGLSTAQTAASPYTATGESAAIASNRVSYTLGLKGPSMSVDTACSSGLVAVNICSQNLQSKTCTVGVVAGVNVLLTVRGFVGTCAAHMLSPNARCKTFDSAADGYARAEGCCAVTLESGFAELDCKISSALNQDGRTANLTSPNGLAQQEVMERAMQHAASSGPEVGLLDAHGTGTAIGDPIELNAQRCVLGHQRSHAFPVHTGAVKSNIGHFEAAAGMVGLLKIMHTLLSRYTASNLHYKSLNQYIQTTNYQFVLPATIQLLPRQPSGSAGVSSFGFGGTNSHAVLQNRAVFAADSGMTKFQTVQYSAVALPWWPSKPSKISSLIGQANETEDGGFVWECKWEQPTCAFFGDHRIGRVPLTPGTGFLHICRVATSDSQGTTGASRITDISFVAIMHLDPDVPSPTIRVRLTLGRVAMESLGSMDEWTLHAHMLSTPASTHFDTSVPWESELICLDTSRPPDLTAGSFYAAIGNDYCSDFRSVQSVWIGDKEILFTRVTLRDELVHAYAE